MFHVFTASIYNGKRFSNSYLKSFDTLEEAIREKTSFHHTTLGPSHFVYVCDDAGVVQNPNDVGTVKRFNLLVKYAPRS